MNARAQTCLDAPLPTASLRLHGVDASYGATQVLRQVRLEVAQGAVTALLGANGAGKTTTLRVISGLLPATAGDVMFAGKSIVHRRANEIAALGVGHVPDGRGTLAEFSVEDNLKVGGYLVKSKDLRLERQEAMFEYFPVLKQRLRQQAGTLSGGEQQMLAIARALMSSPSLLLLDEPSFGIAPLVVQRIFAILREIIAAGGLSVLLIEQNANLALSISDRGYVLESGRVVIEGPSSELARDDSVRRSYLGGGA
jgi:branched-chain amino acid transport system ATP-binding protein